MSTSMERRRIPILLWPLVLLWKFVTLIANLTGIVMALVLGAVFMIVGWVLMTTVIGAVIGIPLFLIGLLLFIRGLY